MSGLAVLVWLCFPCVCCVCLGSQWAEEWSQIDSLPTGMHGLISSKCRVGNRSSVRFQPSRTATNQTLHSLTSPEDITAIALPVDKSRQEDWSIYHRQVDKLLNRAELRLPAAMRFDKCMSRVGSKNLSG